MSGTTLLIWLAIAGSLALAATAPAPSWTNNINHTLHEARK